MWCVALDSVACFVRFAATASANINPPFRFVNKFVLSSNEFMRREIKWRRRPRVYACITCEFCGLTFHATGSQLAMLVCMCVVQVFPMIYKHNYLWCNSILCAWHFSVDCIFQTRRHLLLSRWFWDSETAEKGICSISETLQTWKYKASFKGINWMVI